LTQLLNARNLVASAAAVEIMMPKTSVAKGTRRRKLNKRTRIKGDVMAKSAWTKLPLARLDNHLNELAGSGARKGRRRVRPKKG
jgi:hypothetical protein